MREEEATGHWEKEVDVTADRFDKNGNKVVTPEPVFPVSIKPLKEMAVKITQFTRRMDSITAISLS